MLELDVLRKVREVLAEQLKRHGELPLHLRDQVLLDRLESLYNDVVSVLPQEEW